MRACEPAPELLQEISSYLQSHLIPEGEAFAAQPVGIPELPEPDISFTEAVVRLYTGAGMTANEFYKKANLSRQLFNTLVKRKDYRPTRTTVFACAIGLQLSLEQAKDLLLKAGYAFSASSRTDIIVQYFIENGIYDLDRINDVLYYYDQQPLGSI